MKVIHATIFVVFIFSLMANMSKQKGNKPNIIFVLIIILILGLVSGLRTVMGDTGAYKHSYELVGSGQYNANEGEGYEAGWIKFYEYLNSISKDPQFMLLVTSFIVVTFSILTLRKYSSFFELETYLYITSGTYIVSMNGIRQSVVAAILFWYVKFIIDGKFIPYCIVSLLLMNFHKSAFIMIPVYFIVRLEAWEQKTNKIMAIGIVFVLLYGKLQPLLTSLMQDSSYGGYMYATEGGANIIRTLIAAVPVVLSYVYRKDIKENWNNGNVFINMSIVNLIFMALATYNWIFARFNMYFTLYNVVLIPYIIKCIPNVKEKRLIYYTAVICYAVCYYLDGLQSDYYTPYINI